MGRPQSNPAEEREPWLRKPAKKGTQKSANSGVVTGEASKGFFADEERVAMRERVPAQNAVAFSRRQSMNVPIASGPFPAFFWLRSTGAAENLYPQRGPGVERLPPRLLNRCPRQLVE